MRLVSCKDDQPLLQKRTLGNRRPESFWPLCEKIYAAMFSFGVSEACQI